MSSVYGEQLGLGTHDYELIDIMPIEDIKYSTFGYLSAK